MRLSCVPTSSSHTFVLAYAGASSRDATTTMIGLAVSDSWDGPYRRVDGPLESASGDAEVGISPHGLTSQLQGRITKDGVAIEGDTNMSSISEPFLYVHEMAGTAPSFHLLFMASARGDRLTDETSTCGRDWFGRSQRERQC